MLYESGENYLETMLLLEERFGKIRSTDIASELSVTKASVSRAMSILKKSDYIEMQPYGQIVLTEKGRATAIDILQRHKVVEEFLVCIGCSPKVASDDACRIEHIISAQTFDNIRQFLIKNKTK